jgi:hypothetical protein
VVVGIGTWDASFQSSLPTLLGKYKELMALTLNNMHVAYPVASIYVWNVHYHPISTILWGKCPASDWRHPPLIAQYNAALQHIVKQQVLTTSPVLGTSSTSVSSPPLPPLQYLNTSFILIPQWDSPPDWSHFENIVGSTEALYITAVILGILPRFDMIKNYS